MGRLASIANDRRGGLLVEVLVASLILALVGTAVLAGLSMAHRSGAIVEGQSVAENIARNQMEYVFSLSYQTPPLTFPSVSVPPGYSVTARAEEFVGGNPNIAKIVVTVNRSSEPLLVLETLRVK